MTLTAPDFSANFDRMALIVPITSARIQERIGLRKSMPMVRRQRWYVAIAFGARDAVWSRTDVVIVSFQVDIYSFGNIFYSLIMEEYPFHDRPRKEVPKTVMRGERPPFYADLWNSTDPIIKTLREAMLMCHEQEPEDRASAREVNDFLKKKLEEIDPGRLKEWGEEI